MINTVCEDGIDRKKKEEETMDLKKQKLISNIF